MTFDWAARPLRGHRLRPHDWAAPRAARALRGPLPDLAPGGPIGVSLIEGDLDLSVTGTVTHIDGDRVYAFGHPFYNLGPTQFPMKKAYVYSVYPERPAVLEDRRRPRSGGYRRPGSDHRHRRAASARPHG